MVVRSVSFSYCHVLMTVIHFIAELQALKFTVINLSRVTFRPAYEREWWIGPTILI